MSVLSGLVAQSPAVVLSPHVDDEVLGCFSFLKKGTTVVYGGIEDRPSRAQRVAERALSVDALGFDTEDLDQPVNGYDVNALIPLFEEAVDRLRPSVVLLPCPSYNQDHRAFYDAALVATRPHDARWNPPTVLVYEQPHSITWPYGDNGVPNVFIPIDIEAKLEAYARYASQVRGHRSPETVRAIAAVRGAHASVPNAEAFHALRIVWEPS